MISHQLSSQIYALLEREAAALKSGDIAALAELEHDKATLINALDAAPLQSAKAIEVLQLKIQRNQALIESALRGIKSATTRLAALRRARDKLDIYDAKGNSQSIETARERRFEKRA